MWGYWIRTSWISSRPSMSGMTRSVRITDGVSRAMAASPSRPSLAYATLRRRAMPAARPIELRGPERVVDDEDGRHAVPLADARVVSPPASEITGVHHEVLQKFHGARPALHGFKRLRERRGDLFG